MARIEKQKFQILDVSENNYLSWCLDMKLHLQGLDLLKTLECVDIKEANRKDEANAMIFIRHHLSEDLKDEYIQLERPSEIWQKLKERFDHTKTVILPQAQYEWQHLRLQDFKSVADYNSALFKIESRLALWELISVLLTAQKTNELLLKNHDLRPSGSQGVPEAHANKKTNRFKGRGRKFWRGARNNNWHNGQRRDNHGNLLGGREYFHKNNYMAKRRQLGHGNRDKEKHVESICNRCGMNRHWAKVCRTAQHFVDLYQSSKKNKGKSIQTHAIETEKPNVLLEANTTEIMSDQAPIHDAKSLELQDFLMDID
ncbi:PREDICTED: uncharacterized protein LOC105966904 [Erythranthe guttata]|uniref:uncharacterized protein LOC105966904 n=1 Tax=Erythranthe guttata TaxID=4155 RepID=UPI00064DCF75|nr:PREDICTED: uncharacterized protein LOC105966904 [Erythranthe guttata]|eukprot:XP_012846933.1 PREDICTED: uncharacterized protein LOC105966904 [Erythranthe guttata]